MITMKIVSIRLVNFASIYTGMGLTEVEIDFSKGHNDICLLVGKNGSGKTSLLSNLHPFPYVETIDVRNSQDLILEGKDGLKGMVILDGEDRYDISIHYTIKGDKRKTSCYIMQNFHELNPSGLVRTYYEVIRTVFGIDPSFLRILRLGPNVSDIISMRSTERKEFIKNFLQDIDVYVKLHQTAKEQSVFIKNQIKAITFNLDKNPLTMDEMLAKQTKLETECEKLDKRKSAYAIEIENIKSRLESEVMTSSEIEAAVKAFEDVEFLINKFNTYDVQGQFVDIGRAYEQAVVNKANAEANLNSGKERLTSISSQIAKCLESIKDIEHKQKLVEHNAGIDDFDTLINEYQTKISELGNIKELEQPTSVYENMLRLLKSSEEILKAASDLSIIGIYKKLAAKNVKSNIFEDMSKALDKKIGSISEKIGELKSDKPSWRSLLGGYIMFVPEGCEHSKKCPYVLAIEKIKQEDNDDNHEILTTMFDLYLEAKNKLGDLKIVNNNINTINAYNAEVYFSFGYILGDWINMKYDHITRYEEEVKALISQSMDYDLYVKFNNELDDIKARKEMLDEVGGLAILKSQYDDLKQELNRLQAEEKSYKENTIPELEHELNDAEVGYESIKTIYDVYTKYTSKIDYITKVKHDYDLAVKSRKLEESLKHQLKNATDEYDRVCGEIRDTKYAINHIFYEIQTHRDLEKQLSKLNKEYSDIELIREAVSMSKGIPLLYAQIYLKSIQILANEIIHEMFDQNISLLDFVITDKEFRMPYMVNGIEIEDVNCSSQGERTTIVLALSFALLQQMMGRYNILLLDEVDSALYKDNRRKFIKIVKDQMEHIGCEQAFLITHNALFENYPVDIIQTSDMDDEYNKGNVIWKKEDAHE